MNGTRRRLAKGFTLIEVLIALAIVVMSAGALIGAMTSAASNADYLRVKTLAEWVALNRLTEIRISQNMPDVGKSIGNSVMGGMRWQWEVETIELPVKGMFRIDVHARPTGDVVDDTRETQKQTSQKDPESSPAGGDLDKASWSTTVTGVVSNSRSARNVAIAAPLSGNLAAIPGGAPGTGTPTAPGTSPTNPGYKPGSPSAPPPPTPPPTDR